jgi:hypothetical protein
MQRNGCGVDALWVSAFLTSSRIDYLISGCNVEGDSNFVISSICLLKMLLKGDGFATVGLIGTLGPRLRRGEVLPEVLLFASQNRL